MKNFLGYMFCACLLMSTSAALSDNHLDRTVKFQNGEQYAGCVYGETGTFKYVNEDKKTEVSECGIAWEGKGLFNLVVKRELWGQDLFDLQIAYNCCNNDATRLAICEEASTISAINALGLGYLGLLAYEEQQFQHTKSCANYLDAMRGKLGGIQQPEVNLAAEYGCIKAVAGDVPDYKKWLLDSEYHGRMDLLFDFCKSKEDLIYSAISHMFDSLRDEQDCLWNNPNDDFCAGSRRKEGGWEVTE